MLSLTLFLLLFEVFIHYLEVLTFFSLYFFLSFTLSLCYCLWFCLSYSTYLSAYIFVSFSLFSFLSFLSLTLSISLCLCLFLSLFCPLFSIFFSPPGFVHCPARASKLLDPSLSISQQEHQTLLFCAREVPLQRKLKAVNNNDHF